MCQSIYEMTRFDSRSERERVELDRSALSVESKFHLFHVEKTKRKEEEEGGGVEMVMNEGVRRESGWQGLPSHKYSVTGLPLATGMDR